MPVAFPWYVLIFAGLTLLILGAELLIRGAARLAAAVGLSPLIIGLTVVAVGTSSPEIAVALQSAQTGHADLALGNVMGSNIFNILVVLGLAAVLVPLVVAQRLVRLDVPLMIGFSVAALLMALDGHLTRFEGAVLLAGALLYTLFVIRQGRKESAEVEAEYRAEYGPAGGRAPGRLLAYAGLVLAGLVTLIIGSRWLVDGATVLARSLGVSEVIIGLTIVAIGTSMPEVATSITAVLRGERDIAVGNAVGSNILNLALVLGLTAFVAPSGIVVPAGVLAFDLPVMVAVAIAALPVAFTGYLIARWEGILLLGYYGAFLLYLVLDATRPDAAPLFRGAMLWFVLPLTGITLLVLTSRELRSRSTPDR